MATAPQQRKINVSFTYPNSDAFEFMSKIQIIDLDKEARHDIETGNGFEISSPKSSNKKDMKDPTKVNIIIYTKN